MTHKQIARQGERAVSTARLVIINVKCSVLSSSRLPILLKVSLSSMVMSLFVNLYRYCSRDSCSFKCPVRFVIVGTEDRTCKKSLKPIILSSFKSVMGMMTLIGFNVHCCLLPSPIPSSVLWFTH